MYSVPALITDRLCDGAQVLIDFGLSYNNTMAEDKAVDLYVLERAFTSAHSALGNLVSSASTPICSIHMRSRSALNRRVNSSQGHTACCASSKSLLCWRFQDLSLVSVQFDDVLASYRQHSRMWCPTLNKFAEGGSAWLLGSITHSLMQQSQQPQLQARLPQQAHSKNNVSQNPTACAAACPSTLTVIAMYLLIIERGSDAVLWHMQCACVEERGLWLAEESQEEPD